MTDSTDKRLLDAVEPPRKVGKRTDVGSPRPRMLCFLPTALVLLMGLAALSAPASKLLVEMRGFCVFFSLSFCFFVFFSLLPPFVVVFFPSSPVFSFLVTSSVLLLSCAQLPIRASERTERMARKAIEPVAPAERFADAGPTGAARSPPTVGVPERVYVTGGGPSCWLSGVDAARRPLESSELNRPRDEEGAVKLIVSNAWQCYISIRTFGTTLALVLFFRFLLRVLSASANSPPLILLFLLLLGFRPKRGLLLCRRLRHIRNFPQGTPLHAIQGRTRLLLFHHYNLSDIWIVRRIDEDFESAAA